MSEVQSGIYIIENMIDGRVYVGSAVNINARWGVHRNDLRAQRHMNRHLQRAWDKYQEDAFVFRVLEECPPEQLIELEQYWMDALNCIEDGYNIAPRAGSNLGLSFPSRGRPLLALTPGHLRYIGLAFRQAQHIGVRPLARAAHIRPGTIIDIEKGRHLPDMHTVECLLAGFQALGVSAAVGDLLVYEPAPPGGGGEG